MTPEETIIRTDETSQRPGLAFSALRIGSREAVADDDEGLGPVAVDGVQQLLGIEGRAFQRDHRAAGHHCAHPGQQTCAVHQRRGGEVATRGSDSPGMVTQRLEGLGHRAQLSGRLQGDLAQVVVGPHHALRHAGGAAGVDEELVLAASARCRQAPPLPSTARSPKRSAKLAVRPSALTSIQVFTPGRRGWIWVTVSRNSEA